MKRQCPGEVMISVHGPGTNPLSRPLSRPQTETPFAVQRLSPPFAPWSAMTFLFFAWIYFALTIICGPIPHLSLSAPNELFMDPAVHRRGMPVPNPLYSP